MGAHVRVAYDGEAALAIISEFKPRLALLDIGMPGMDGYETARQIRTLPEAKGFCCKFDWMGHGRGSSTRHGGGVRSSFREADGN